MKTQLSFLFAALFLLPSLALAAPESPAERNDEGAIVSEDAGVREVIFDQEDSIEGEVLTPGGAKVGGQRAKEHASMIGIRGEFVAQLIWLSNDI